MTKRTISLILTFALILGCFNFVSASSDIENHWAEDSIKYLLNKGIVEGYPNGKFIPNKQITRAEFVALINRTLYLKDVGTVGFEDVTEDDWFYKDIAKAVAEDYIQGYSEKEFRPNSLITREEAATIIGRAFGLGKLDKSPIDFTDAESIQYYAVGYVNAAADKGFIQGYPNGQFSPRGELTRAEAATILFNIITGENAPEEPKEPEVPDVPVNPGPRPDPKPNPEDKLAAAIVLAEKAIANLPSLDDIRIEKKEAVLKAIELTEEVYKLDENATIEGTDLLSEMLEKIEYLENEEGHQIRFTQVSPEPYELFNSTVGFEGYFYGAKYIDRVLIEDTNGEVETIEAEVEYIDDWEFQGRTYPAYRYTANVDIEDGYYVMRVIGISQSGKQNNTATRFSVDTTAPELDIEILGVDEYNTTTKESVEVNVTMRDNFANLTLYRWDSYEFGQIYPTSDSRFRQPAEYTKTITLDLDIGENEIPFKLIDGAGNQTTETITIFREPVVTGKANIQLWKDGGSDRVGFDLIEDSFYIRDIKTGEEFGVGTVPWNVKNAYQMIGIPVGEYTIHFELPEGLYIEDIELGGSYNYTIYDPETNLLVIDDLGSNFNYARINIRANTLLKEIRELDITLPKDTSYDKFLEIRPDKTIVVDENEEEHEVDVRFSPNKVQYENGVKDGALRVQSQSAITLPLYISNTTSPIRPYAYLNITFTD